MKSLPIVRQFKPDPDASLLAVMERTCRRLRRERPDLLESDGLARLQSKKLSNAPVLHLDDQSDTNILYTGFQIHFRQDLARIRAGEGDLVAAASPPAEEYEVYCRERLNLGTVEWICPRTTGDRSKLAAALWQDETTRQRLLARLREESLQIDPYQGNASVWQLAALMHHERPDRVRVVAPLPQVTAWVNNKGEFTQLACELFGEDLVPRTRNAANLAMAAEAIRELVPHTKHLVIKLPDSAGGGGNLRLDCQRFRQRSLSEIHADLQHEFRDLAWSGETELLIGEWEPEVLSAPSAQLWIPPGAELPVVEGLFEQVIGDGGSFLGARPAELDAELSQEIVDRSWLLARLFQRLGYVGRCSFDLLVVPGNGHRRVKFLECNGRWGGASMPMTLMNRLLGDWTRQPFVTRNYDELNLQHVSFARILEGLSDELFDVRTRRGRLILINPAKMQARGGIGAIVLGETLRRAEEAADGEIMDRLRALGH